MEAGISHDASPGLPALPHLSTPAGPGAGGMSVRGARAEVSPKSSGLCWGYFLPDPAPSARSPPGKPARPRPPCGRTVSAGEGLLLALARPVH